MARRLIKFLAALVVIIILSVPITALLLDDETFSSWLGELSVPAKNAEALLKQKRSIGITLGEYVSDAFGGIEAFYFAVMGHTAPQKPMRTAVRGSKQVVIDLPSPPTTTPSAKPAIISSPPPQIEVRKKQPAIAPSGIAPAAATTPAVTPPPKRPAKKSVVKEHKVTPHTATNNPPRKIAPTADQDRKRGLLFYKGIGVDKDFKKAAQWFRRAANKGHAGAQYYLGIMSYLGQGMD
ncbi:MAG: tetratricopeptide repeat protein [Rhodospirillales bacterium]